MTIRRLTLAAGFAALTLYSLLPAPAHADPQSARRENHREGEISPLSGVYVGGFGGYGWTDGEVEDTDIEFDINGGDYGLFVGYQLDTLLDRTIGLGINGAIEAHYAWSSADDDDTIAGIDVDAEKDHEWGISFRPGLSFVNDYAFGLKPYGILGYRNAQYSGEAGGFSGDENYHGFEAGIGTELVAYDDFGVRLEYSHVWYGEKDGFDPDENDLRLGVAYHF